MQVLEGEVALSRKQLTSNASENDTSITATNYEFAVLRQRHGRWTELRNFAADSETPEQVSDQG
jgi:hypothetical protein